MPLVTHRVQYASGDIIILRGCGVEVVDGTKVSTLLLAVGEYLITEVKDSRLHLMLPFGILEMSARGTSLFRQCFGDTDTFCITGSEYEIVGIVGGGLDLYDGPECRDYLKQVASKLKDSFDFGILTDEEGD